ncbi:MAG TPA: hypothetical protein EYG94_00385 [Campylobacterales bacterium]|nr:hypothetical protein [Campylobacterales bacterium]
MTKLLQILFGLVLILVLAYIAFLNVSTKIKDDLLTKTKVMFSENNVRHVAVNMQGEGLSVSRTLVLTGTAISDVERIRIVKLTENIEGICSIDNQIRLHPLVPKPPEVPVVSKVVTVIKTPVVKVSAESIVSESTPKELVTIEDKVEPKAQTQVEKKTLEASVSSMKTTTKTPAVPVASTKMTTKVPLVPKVENKDIVVPTPVSAIAAPNVIRIEKIKLEGVK